MNEDDIMKWVGNAKYILLLLKQFDEYVRSITNKSIKNLDQPIESGSDQQVGEN